MARKYEISHPWIKFQFDARKLDYHIWLLLGEAVSKCEHIKGAPLLPDTLELFNQVYLAKGVLATTAIEGNTLSEFEVARRIKGELDLPPSKEYLGQEIDNIVKVINKVGKTLLTQDSTDLLSVIEIKNYNREILTGLPLNEGVVPGEIRDYSVGIATYRGAPAEDCEYLLDNLVSWLNSGFIYPPEQRAIYGILKAILAHLYFVWVHPFGDGNGRTARLIEFQILLLAGIPNVAAHLMSNHYNETRVIYYQMLEKSSKNEDSVIEFIRYALQGFVDGLKEEIDQIQAQQIKVHWINHIHNRFKGLNSKTEERKKELMLELSLKSIFEFGFEEIRHSSARIAEKYANLGDITIKRDLSDLVDMELLMLIGKRYHLNIRILGKYLTIPRARG